MDMLLKLIAKFLTFLLSEFFFLDQLPLQLPEVIELILLLLMLLTLLLVGNFGVDVLAL